METTKSIEIPDWVSIVDSLIEKIVSLGEVTLNYNRARKNITNPQHQFIMSFTGKNIQSKIPAINDFLLGVIKTNNLRKPKIKDYSGMGVMEFTSPSTKTLKDYEVNINSFSPDSLEVIFKGSRGKIDVNRSGF